MRASGGSVTAALAMREDPRSFSAVRMKGRDFGFNYVSFGSEDVIEADLPHQPEVWEKSLVDPERHGAMLLVFAENTGFGQAYPGSSWTTLPKRRWRWL